MSDFVSNKTTCRWFLRNKKDWYYDQTQEKSVDYLKSSFYYVAFSTVNLKMYRNFDSKVIDKKLLIEVKSLQKFGYKKC
jgi:hypothetical protein